VKEAALELWNELMAFRPDQLALLFVAAMTAVRQRRAAATAASAGAAGEDATQLV
jgi:hypothetical protein